MPDSETRLEAGNRQERSDPAPSQPSSLDSRPNPGTGEFHFNLNSFQDSRIICTLVPEPLQTSLTRYFHTSSQFELDL